MRKIFLLTALIAVLMAGCMSPESDPGEGILISAVFFPVAEISKAITSDTAEVSSLIPSGVDAHSYEPTPIEVARLSSSDVFVTMGGMFEHIEEEVLSANPDLYVIEATHSVQMISGEEHSHEEEEADEHSDEGDYDPHVWLSIDNMIIMTDEIAEHLIERYPQNSELYEQNARDYKLELEGLKKEFEQRLSSCEKDVIIVNHLAFGYLAEEYGFEQVSVSGFSPESEPSPETLRKVIDEAKEHDLSYVFSEGQMDPKVAQTIAGDIGGEVLELSPVKTSEDQDYFSMMRQNLDNLAIGLECR